MAVPISMPPVAPMGWPRAMAPPSTLTTSWETSRSFMNFSTTDANASLISQRSMSFLVMPAFFRQFCAAGPGAVSMISGSVPAVADMRRRARGFRPWALA
jgi:hypothetical protein